MLIKKKTNVSYDVKRVAGIWSCCVWKREKYGKRKEKRDANYYSALEI